VRDRVEVGADVTVVDARHGAAADVAA
jgi:hypothetical protein